MIQGRMPKSKAGSRADESTAGAAQLTHSNPNSPAFLGWNLIETAWRGYQRPERGGVLSGSRFPSGATQRLDNLLKSRQESGVSVILSYASRLSGAGAGIRRTRRQVQPRLGSLVGAVVAIWFLLCVASWSSLAEETNSPAPAAISITDTNSQALLQAYQQLQEQFRLTQLAIEQNRQEIKAAAAQNAESLSQALQSIQENFAAQRARDLEAMQQSNKLILIVVGTFSAMGFLTLLMMSYFQWRMSKGLAEISAAVPAALGLGAGSATGALDSAGQLNLRLPGVTPPHDTSSRAAELRLYHNPVTSLRRPRLRPLRAAVIVGLICAAVLALVFYALTYRQLGFGSLLDVLKI